MQKKFLTTDEITEGYGIDGETVQSLVEAGDLKALADRGTWKYRREDIESLIKAGRLHPTKELPTVDDVELDETFSLESGNSASPAADFLELDEEALAEQPTIIRSGSALDDESVLPQESDSDVHIVFEPTVTNVSDSDIRLGGTDLFASAPTGLPGDGSDSDVRTAPDSGEVGQFDGSKTEEIPIDDMDDSSVLDEPVRHDEQGGLETMSEMATDWSDQPAEDVFAIAEDSGIKLEDDSGISLEAGDSGIQLDIGDSGITLDAGDSGISLDAGDSGIKLEDAGQPVDPLAATENQMDFRLAEEEEPPRPVLDREDRTAEFVMDSAEQAVSPTLSGAIAAGDSVEDLEVSPDLDDVLEADDDEFAEAELEDEVLEADDEAFSDEYEAAGEDEELAGVPGKAAPREPGWGAPVFVLALSAALLVGANMWLAWEGLATMWTGSEPSGPAASLVSTIAGLM